MSTVVVLVAAQLAQPAQPTQPAPRDAELLALAAGLGHPVAVVVTPPGSGGSAPSQGWPTGVATVLEVPVDGGAGPLASTAALEAAVAALREAGEAVVAVLVPADADGRETAARLAVRLDAGVIADAVELRLDAGVVVARTRPLGGTWDVEVAVPTGLAVVTVAGSGRSGGGRSGGGHVAVAQPAVRVLPPVAVAGPAPQVVRRRAKPVAERPDLTQARVVVAAGRGTDGDLSAVEALADVLGGAVGVSRAVVEAGWAERDLQIGQTGQQVSPQLYVAAGISGAIQHRSGMQTSKAIVAINSDPEAAIFELADLGVVGDLFEVLPQVTREIERRRRG